MNKKPMRVLLVTQNFYPENFKSNDIAFNLAEKGYIVDVLTGIPNYPEGRYYNGFGIFKKRFEVINNVKIYRAYQVSRGHNNKIRLSLNYLSFAFFASLWAIYLSIFKEYNCVIVHAPSPITQVLPAVIVKNIRKIPIYLWVLDLWPDAMVSGGGIKNKIILDVVNRFVKFIYRNSEKILISSEAFNSSISEKGDFEKKIVYFPNWSDDIINMPTNFPIPSLPEGFIILLAGNLGISQNLESVINAAKELRQNKKIKWIIVGDGSKKKWLEEAIKYNGLEDIIYTFGRYPFEAMPSFFNKANALLITLSGEFSELKLVVPARLQSYMSAGKPVLGMINGASADLIRKANCGYCVNSGDYNSLSLIIRNIISSDLESFEHLGKNGRKYFEDYFSKEKCIGHLCNIIDES